MINIHFSHFLEEFVRKIFVFHPKHVKIFIECSACPRKRFSGNCLSTVHCSWLSPCAAHPSHWVPHWVTSVQRKHWPSACGDNHLISTSDQVVISTRRHALPAGAQQAPQTPRGRPSKCIPYPLDRVEMDESLTGWAAYHWAVCVTMIMWYYYLSGLRQQGVYLSIIWTPKITCQNNQTYWSRNLEFGKFRFQSYVNTYKANIITIKHTMHFCW